MRVIGLKEFLTMPPGTPYMRYLRCFELGDLCIKKETIGEGWLYDPIYGIKCYSSEEFADIIGKADQDSTFEFQNTSHNTSRDLSDEKSDRFVIYSETDLFGMINALSEALWQLRNNKEAGK